MSGAAIPVPAGATVGPPVQAVPVPAGAIVGPSVSTNAARTGSGMDMIHAVAPDFAQAHPAVAAAAGTLLDVVQGGGREALAQAVRLAKYASPKGGEALEKAIGDYTVPINAPGEGTGRAAQQAMEFVAAPEAEGGAAAKIAQSALTGGAVTALQGGNPVAGAAGGAVGAAVASALPSAGGAVASRLYRSALKPSTTLPLAQTERMVQTGIANSIPVSAAGLEKLGGLIDDLNGKISDVIAADPDRAINPAKAMQNLPAVRAKFATQVNPTADVQAVDSAGQEFLDQFRGGPGQAVRTLTAAEAQAMKQGTYRALGDKAYGELKSASVEAQKALARGLKDELANQFPELANLNAADSKLLDLQEPLQRAVARISNHQIVGIGTPIAAAGGAAVTGNAGAGAVSGFIKAIVDDPVVKSRLAMAISRASKIPYGQAYAKVGGYIASLASQPDEQQTADTPPNPASGSVTAPPMRTTTPLLPPAPLRP